MNIALAFLMQNWERLSLERFGVPSRLSYVMATPRFRSSSHVIFLILADGLPDPILVVKVPRLPGDTDGLDREAANLRMVQAVLPGGFDSIPHLVTYEPFPGTSRSKLNAPGRSVTGPSTEPALSPSTSSGQASSKGSGHRSATGHGPVASGNLDLLRMV